MDKEHFTFYLNGYQVCWKPNPGKLFCGTNASSLRSSLFPFDFLAPFHQVCFLTATAAMMKRSQKI